MLFESAKQRTFLAGLPLLFITLAAFNFLLMSIPEIIHKQYLRIENCTRIDFENRFQDSSDNLNLP